MKRTKTKHAPDPIFAVIERPVKSSRASRSSTMKKRSRAPTISCSIKNIFSPRPRRRQWPALWRSSNTSRSMKPTAGTTNLLAFAASAASGDRRLRNGHASFTARLPARCRRSRPDARLLDPRRRRAKDVARRGWFPPRRLHTFSPGSCRGYFLVPLHADPRHMPVRPYRHRERGDPAALDDLLGVRRLAPRRGPRRSEDGERGGGDGAERYRKPAQALRSRLGVAHHNPPRAEVRPASE